MVEAEEAGRGERAREARRWFMRIMTRKGSAGHMKVG